MILALHSLIFLQTPPLSAVLQPSSRTFLTVSRTYQACFYQRTFGNPSFCVIYSLYSDFCSNMTPKEFTNYVCLFFVFFLSSPFLPHLHHLLLLFWNSMLDLEQPCWTWNSLCCSQPGFELVILQPSHLQCWSCRYVWHSQPIYLLYLKQCGLLVWLLFFILSLPPPLPLRCQFMERRALA